MATNPTRNTPSDGWATVLGRVEEFDGRRPMPYDVQIESPYGVAVESALEDLATAAAHGRPLAPYLREATRVGCPADQILIALDEVRGSGAAAPPL